MKQKVLKVATKVLITLFALTVAYITMDKAFDIADECWEQRTISSVGWEGYCSNMETVNPKHYLKCEEVLNENKVNNTTVQYDLED
jgi:hypothetical protein